MKRKPFATGLVDLHFHGAYGIDLMTASQAELTRLASRLAGDGIAGFCPTTLSMPRRELHAAVERLGHWIRSVERDSRIARPLGIHLEGPFVSPKACGAHPPRAIRTLDFDELEALWRASRERLKILTLAPEELATGQLPRLARWAKARRVLLSLGHSRADEKTAEKAFRAGFSGVTHAWNALSFHQREPGALGAAIGRPGVYLELIPDGVHVAPTVIEWTCALHQGPICFVSDCVPSGGTRGGFHSFGPLKVRREDGASRTANGRLAGGGDPLSRTYLAWVRREALRLRISEAEIIRRSLRFVTTDPLKALGLRRVSN